MFAKKEFMLAKPFVAELNGDVDTVEVPATRPASVTDTAGTPKALAARYWPGMRLSPPATSLLKIYREKISASSLMNNPYLYVRP